jgi:dTDP-3-amino-3,4,6-trideoxy-alpha-D-glucose transaminase
VHLFGNVAPVAEIEALGVPVLEDAAQAAGSTVCAHRADSASPNRSGSPDTDAALARPGALGRAATFSFFPSKNLACFGDGGMIATSDPQIAERARTLRFHGSRDKVTYLEVGCNSRLDELQAAILRVQLPHLDTWSQGRRAAGAHYERAGLGELVALPAATEGARPAWHLYVVSHPDPDQLQSALAQRQIGCKAYYRTPIHRQPAMREWGEGLELPGTEQAARTHLAIPMSPVLTRAQAEEVVAAVRG